MGKNKNWFEAEIEFELGGNKIAFKIYHNISQVEGPIDTLDAALDCWLARTVKFSAESFVAYINSKGIHQALTEEQWKKLYTS